jgi:hypothetical protein
MEQLRDAGFEEFWAYPAPKYIWMYGRESDGASLTVVIFLNDDTFTMHMIVNFFP